MADLVRPLDAVRRGDIAEVGGKAANLGELIAGGFDVPPGFVVTTAAYDAYLDDCGLRGSVERLGRAADPAVRDVFDRDLPARIRDAIARDYSALGGLVAVRSSATAEDLAGASFAGQQETFLGVEGLDAVLDAVRRCWASLWTDRAMDYRARQGIDPADVALAVVVQRLVVADAAGIMFTANPANGQRDETVIDASFGLGEAVVGGDVTPDEIVVRIGVVVSRETADKRVMTTLAAGGTQTADVARSQRLSAVLTDAEALELAALGRRVEAHFGAPQDIEWVRSGGTFALVQSRPITALPAPVGPVPTEWLVEDPHALYIRASIVEQLPAPLTPLFADLIRPAVRDSVTAIMTRFAGENAVRPGEIDFVTINGYAYYTYASALMARLLMLTPAAIPRLVGQEGGIESWRHVGHPRYVEIVARYADREVSTLPAVELLDAAATLVDAGATYYTSVQAVIPVAAMSEILFTSAYRLVRRAGDPPATTFLLGFDSEPLRAERSLYELALWVRTQPHLAAALRTGAPLDDPSMDASARAELARRLTAHLGEFGHTTYDLDTASPVPADDPTPVLAALRFYLGDDERDGSAVPDPRERQARQAAERESASRALLARLDPVRRAVIGRLLQNAQQTAPVREDALADIGLGWPAARRHLIELGRRLVDAGVLAEPDGVHWLTRAEAQRLAAGLDAGVTTLDPMAQIVAARQEEWRGRRLADPPAWLPKGGWEKAFRPFMPSRSGNDGDVLTGLGASTGRAEGVVRVLHGPEDFASMRPGEVLVASITTPAYTPLFALASAVVTDIGGPLSHSSIVAREYGIPAVLGTGSATRRIATGDEVVVDGDRGRVLLGDGRAEAPADRDVRRWIPAAVAGGALVAAGMLVRRRRHRTRRR